MVAANKLTPMMSTPTATEEPLVQSLMWTQDLGREHGFEPLRVEGVLPKTLKGTLYRNGPGQFGQFGRRYSHPFEADGAAHAIRIAGGAATGASRIHQTAGLVEERAAGKIKYGLAAPWRKRLANMWRGRQKNTANTNIIVWQGRLFALMEAGRPTEIDPKDLSTIGETDLGGVVGEMFSAHPHRVASRNALYNYGLEYGRKTKLHLYELPDAGAARRIGTVDLGYAPMLHDFIATDSHLVFFVSPTRVNIPRMMTAIGTFEQLFQWKPENGTEVICVPIDRPTEVLRFTTDAFYQWHFTNAWTRANELVIDYVRYADFSSFRGIGHIGAGGGRELLADGMYHRAVVDLAARTIVSEQLSDRACEFPTVAPGDEGREHRTAYAVFGDLGGIGAIDGAGRVTEHQLPAGERATEPLYADGYLLTLTHARDAAYVGVYDAARIPDGPVAKIWIDHHVPITFHGTFAPDRG